MLWVTVRNNSWFQTFAMFWMLYAFFWVISRRLNFICRRFGTLCLFHLHRQVGACRMNSAWAIRTEAISKPNLFPYNTANMSSAEFILHAPTCLWRWNRQCSETQTYKIQTPGNHPKESIQHRIYLFLHLVFKYTFQNFQNSKHFSKFSKCRTLFKIFKIQNTFQNFQNSKLFQNFQNSKHFSKFSKFKTFFKIFKIPNTFQNFQNSKHF